MSSPPVGATERQEPTPEPQPSRSSLPSCLLLAIAGLLSIVLFVGAVGIITGRIGDLFSFNPFGVFAEPDTEISLDQPAVVLHMQELARLETMNFTIEKVIEAEKAGNIFQDVFFGDRILLIANGNVIAGVDLGKLQDENVVVSNGGKTVRVTLPAAEIFVATLNNDLTRVYDRDRGLLSRGDSQMETKARQAAEANILTATCEQGILTQAAAGAKTQITSLLSALGFETVYVDAPVGVCEER